MIDDPPVISDYGHNLYVQLEKHICCRLIDEKIEIYYSPWLSMVRDEYNKH